MALRDTQRPLRAGRIVAVGALFVAGVRHAGSATASMIGGAFCGPFLGVTLSLFALAHAEAGVVASIAAFYPIPTIFVSSLVHAEPITTRALAGAIDCGGDPRILDAAIDSRANT